MNGKISLDTITEFETEDGEIVEILVKKDFDYGELTHYSTATVKNLRVERVSTTTSETDSDGALTITCISEDGIRIDVRTATQLVKTVDGVEVAVTEQDFPLGTVITVRGVVDSFKGEYQIKVFNMNDIIYH
jgi:DNA/RNA endonuclease YhcR with UshA esterase domain